MITPPRRTITPAELETAAKVEYEYLMSLPPHYPWPAWDKISPEPKQQALDGMRNALSAIGIEVHP